MLKVINEFYLSQKYCSIYTNNSSTTSFIFGKILCFDETFFVIEAVSPNGIFDGIIVKEIDSLVYIEHDSQYSKKMLDLMRIHNYKAPQYNITDSCILSSAIGIALENKHIVSIELLNSGLYNITGFIDGLSEEICKINQIDQYGNEDGHSIIQLSSITQLCFLSEDELCIELLWKSHHKN